MLLMVVVGLAALVLTEDNNLVGSLSLLVFPVTLVGAVVISLESTPPLAERLLRHWKIGLVLAIATLWVATLSRLRVYADITQMIASGWSQLMSFTSWFKS